MEIIMISESKLKVMLSAEDLQEFDLETESLDYNNTETKRMFWDILNRAKHSVGFDTDGQRVLVQLYPSRAGGCEMFITKLGSVCRSEENPSPKTELKTVIKPISRQSGDGAHKASDTRPCVFSFDRMEALLAACRRLSGIGYTGESEAYMGDDRRAYLFLCLPDHGCYLPLDEYAFLHEYGARENTESFRHFVGEHANAICQSRAVETLAAF